MRPAALALVALALVAGCTQAPPPPLPPEGALDPACPAGPGTRPFAHPGLVEVSGLARSGQVRCLLWAHNDSGNTPLLYATDAEGRRLGEVEVPAPVADWEDIAGFALDGAPHLLAADLGNNLRTRGEARFLVLPEPRPDAAGLLPRAAEGVRGIAVRYPGAPFDAEAVAVDAGRDLVLVVSKGDGPDQALYTASLSQGLRDGAVTLALRAPLTGMRAGGAGAFGGLAGGAATAMDLRPDGGAVAVLTYRDIYVWPRGPEQGWEQAMQGTPALLALPADARQAEALAYSDDGAWLLVGDEQGQPNSRLTVLRAP